jgi:hypothetical protein
VAVTISADNPRSIRAIEIAAHAEQWRHLRTPDGQEAFGIASQRDPGRVYVVTSASCQCEDFLRSNDAATTNELQPCKHILAVRLYCELVRAQERGYASAKPQESRAQHLRVVR